MTIEEVVLNHLLDVISGMKSGEFEINNIQYDGFQRTWEKLTPDGRREIGKAFAEKVRNHEVNNVEYISTSSDNHNHYKIV